MSNHPHAPRVAPSSEASGSPDTQIVERVCYDPPAIDPHGFDTSEYDWHPVRRKPRADGWSNERQRDFIGHLADEGSVTLAAQAVGMSVTSCYRLRRAPGAENFARAWDAAIGEAGKRLLDVAFERATIGVEVPVFDRDGQVIAIRNRPSDRMLIFLLRTKLGDRLGLGLRDTGERGEPTMRSANAPARTELDALPTVAQAMIALEPAQPEVPPHLAMTPDELAHKVRLADIADGTLPHWLRDEPVAPPLKRGVNGLTDDGYSRKSASREASPLGEEFEELLAAAKKYFPEALSVLDGGGSGANDPSTP